MSIRKKGGKAQDTGEKFLDVNATMQGTLRFDDPVNLRISGKFEGMLDTKGMLIVGPKADIKANITGEDINIGGNVTGNIKASKVLRLESTARLDGDIETPRLSISDGAVLVGQVRMENASNSSAASGNNNPDMMDIDQVAKYLEVDLQKVNDWASSGMLPGVSHKGSWMFEKRKIDEWIATGKTKS